MTSFCLLMGFTLGFTAWAMDEAWFPRPVSSPARQLSGRELLRIAEIHDAQNHFTEALTYYDQALGFFRSTKQRREEAATLVKIALIFERQGRREAAADRLREALSHFAKHPREPAHAEALLALGRLSAWLGSREEAARLLKQALGRFDRSHNVHGQGSALIGLGLLLVSDDRQEEGMEFLQRALRDAQDRHDDGQTLAALFALGDARWLMDQPDRAEAHYAGALLLAQKRLQTRLEADLQHRLSSVYAVMGRQADGILSAKRAVTLYQSLRDPSGEAASWTLLASHYQAMGQEDQREDAMQRALSIYRRQQVVVHAMADTRR